MKKEIETSTSLESEKTAVIKRLEEICKKEVDEATKALDAFLKQWQESHNVILDIEGHIVKGSFRYKFIVLKKSV